MFNSKKNCGKKPFLTLIHLRISLLTTTATFSESILDCNTFSQFHKFLTVLLTNKINSALVSILDLKSINKNFADNKYLNASE